jgi:hypothetical protein
MLPWFVILPQQRIDWEHSNVVDSVGEEKSNFFERASPVEILPENFNFLIISTHF